MPVTTPKSPELPRPVHFWTGFGGLCMSTDGRDSGAVSSTDLVAVTCDRCKVLIAQLRRYAVELERFPIPGRRSRYGFEKMAVGDSFFVSRLAGAFKVRYAAWHYSQRHPEYKFTCLCAIENGIRGKRVTRVHP